MNFLLTGVIAITGLITIFLLIGLINKLWQERLGWNAYGNGRDGITYTQKIDKKWEYIEIDREILTKKVNQVIYFKTEKEWSEYPKWAQNRMEIINRIKSKYPMNITEYKN
ncbi:hypothetical protein ATE84_1579 [Aquimarina sp. MAR_2010_214]|uniref:hypothetical protein n=1 Tax=Aquimarina sp. MAR_2010_214 TaxID=1250026 RepID=UPI000C704F52|nr:hypothetical protein [Aquimarina sp. MAR_2010_214]PKV49549.1 hypothetical protein ATE84_1579 [Aquimarina sp. MAR_2010_214]